MIRVTGTGLSRQDVVAVARHGETATLDESAAAAMNRSRAHVETLAAAAVPAYGVSTGFGALADEFIPEDRRRELQRSLIRSHAAGMGPEVEREVVRAMMLLRARTLASGRTGARPVVAHRLLEMLAADVTPVVPRHGSLGASGDLAPLAHVGLGLIGEGQVRSGHGLEDAAVALERLGWDPITLEAKEGLALINGTDGMLGMLILALEDFAIALDAADLIAAMTTEALLGTDRAFQPDLVALRPQPGQQISAAAMTRAMADSEIVSSHRTGDSRVQDAYSLRCSPQVHGAARDTVTYAATVADNELRSAIDNPVVTEDGRIESCGNFHGAPVAMVCDFLAIAAAEVTSIAERRLDRMLDPARSQGLPPFLTTDPGVSSGLMIAHYTSVAVTAENRRLAAPASVDSMPTSAMQEDHVSMGWAAARKLRRSVRNVARVLGAELIAASQALELRAPLRPGPVSAAALSVVRKHIPPLTTDRHLAPDLEVATGLVARGVLREVSVSDEI